MIAYRFIAFKPALVICLFLLFSCAKEDEPPTEPIIYQCAVMHYGAVLIRNVSGQEIAYNFPNGQHIDCYGLIAENAEKMVQNVFSATIKVRCLHILSGEVSEYVISVKDCENTILIVN